MTNAEILTDRLIEQLHLSPGLKPDLLKVCQSGKVEEIEQYLVGLFREQLEEIRDRTALD